MNVKMIMIVSAVSLLLSGCSNGRNNSSSVSSAVTSVPVNQESFSTYTDAVNSLPSETSFTVAVKSSYSFGYSDDSTDLYSMDGVLAVMNENNDPNAHITQHILSNGMQSDMEGYYYDGRLYNSYNGVNYYEDMDISTLERTMLIPLKPYAYDKSMVKRITSSQDDGSTVYTILLNDNSAADLFSTRYDQYGFNKYDDYKITSASVTDTFNSDGSFKKEETSFTGSVSYQSQNVSFQYTSSCEYADGDTKVAVSDEQKEKDSAYVSYNDIDVSSITSDEKDDSAESTVSATFRKRLINRLGYEVQADGTLKDTFNTESSYMIDFGSCTFEYVNYTIAYVYNWKTDTGAMDACTYDFANGSQSGSCQESTVETIKDVKNYLQMELYYCGLSLEDLQKEAQS